MRPSTFFGGEPGLPGVSALAWPSLASSSRANGATARAAARGSQAGVLLRAQPRAASWIAAARICSTRVTPEQAEGQREANRSGRRARAWSTLDSRLGREPRPHKHELELVLGPSASAAGSQGSLLRVYENRLQVYTELVKSVLTICRSSPNSQRLSVYTRRPNWLRPPTLIIPIPCICSRLTAPVSSLQKPHTAHSVKGTPGHAHCSC